MNVKRKFILAILIILLAFTCSCTKETITTDKYYYLAAALLEEELETNGISVTDTTIEFTFSGVPSSVKIIIYIENYTDEEAERIFDEIIFPYMSRDNDVVDNLMMPECCVARYAIVVSGEDGALFCTSDYLSQRCELWETRGGIVCLEDYR